VPAGAEAVYNVLDGAPRSIAELSRLAKVSVADAAARLVDLEVGGLAARAAGGRYHRSSV
jgi:hypothetical protein